MTKKIIGIDVSAKTLDICIKENGEFQSVQIENSTKAIHKFIKPHLVQMEHTIISMENTGRYNWNLYEALEKFQFEVYVIMPLRIKRSIGLTRGKNDKIDAQRICDFTERHLDDIIPWKPQKESLKQLKILSVERSQKVAARKRLSQQNKDYEFIKDSKLKKKLTKLNKQNIDFLSVQITEIEKLIEQTIEADTELKEQSERMQSVPGVGKVLSTALLIKTEGFSTYEDPRKLACCAGVVPFDHQSGTSINYRHKVSHMADKSLKTLLHLAALSTIRLDNDFRKYFERKVAEGKNKMSVINAIRNKLIHVIYALIKNKSFYENRLAMS